MSTGSPDSPPPCAAGAPPIRPGPTPLARSIVRILLRITLALAGLILIGLLITPMGSGSDARIARFLKDLHRRSDAELRLAYPHQVHVADFDDGGQVVAICDDSHSSYFGGNMVVKFPGDRYLSFKGHVCGDSAIGWCFRAYEGTCKGTDVPSSADGFYEWVQVRWPGLRPVPPAR